MANYVKNEDLLVEIKKSIEQDQLTEKAIKMLMMIAQRTNNRLYYSDPMDKEDCVSGAYMEMLSHWRCFNPDRGSNPFAFFTTVAKNGFAKTWKKLHPEKLKGSISLSNASIENEPF